MKLGVLIRGLAWGTVLFGMFSLDVPAQPVMPEVVVRANTVDGGQVSCYSFTCAGLVTQMQFDWQLEHATLPADDVALDKTLFCNKLKQLRPAGCSSAQAPSAPIYDPLWQGNGCGPVSVPNWARNLTSVALNNVSPNYSGDLDAPFPGVSFLGACNAHDRCYATDMNRLGCDDIFNANMNNACSDSTSGNALTICTSFAATYFTAVVQFGQSAYNEAQKVQQCAAWHFEMSVNGCPK